VSTGGPSAPRMQRPTSRQPVDSARASEEPPRTRIQQLRRATRSAHDRFELSLPLLDPSLSHSRYVGVVQAFYGFYAPLEPLCERAAGAAGATLDLAARAKARLLAADLAALGHAASDVLALPRCRHLPTVTSASQAMGVLYVLEGATLGGQIIRRHLLSALGLDAAHGAAFFTGYGDRTREMWLRFTDHIDRAADLEIDTAIAAALATFDTMARWFAESAAPR
jgi:heme oxygenase